MSTTGSTGPPATAPNLSLIYIISFLDLFAVSLIIPIFTTIYKSLDLDPITFGLVSSVYGLAQFLCNPIIGRLSDRYGRKSLLLLSFLGSAVGYLLLGAATTVWMLFLSRVVVGVVKQTLTIAQAWITDHCPHLDDRMRVYTSVLFMFDVLFMKVVYHDDLIGALGRLRTAMSLGFIVGPAAGGLLSARVGQMAPALVAALLYLVDFVIVFFFVDEQRQQHHPTSPTPLPPLPHDDKTERADESNNDEGGLQEDTSVKKKEGTKASTGVVRQLQLVWEVFTRPKVGRLLLIKFMIHLAVAMGRANFGLFMLERFGLGPEGSSYMTSVMGVTGVVTGLIHAPLTRTFPHHALLVAAGLLLGLYNGVTAFTTSLALFVALQPVASLSHLVLSTSALASFSHAFNQREIGLAMGVAGSVNSIGDIVAPLLAGVLFNFVGLGGPRVISSLLIFIAFSLFVVLGTTTTNASSSSSSSSSFRVLKSSTSPSSPTIDGNTKKD